MSKNIKISKLFFVWKTVFKNPKYIVLALLSSLIFFTLNGLIIQWPNKHLFTFSNIFDFLFIGFFYLVERNTFYSTLILSLLTGLLISLVTFKIIHLNNSKSTNILSFSAIFLGSLVPGCAACGIGLISLIGLAAPLVYLPFKGFEISILAISIMIFAIYHTSYKLFECERIKFK